MAHVHPGIKWSVIATTVLVLPFMVLEWVNRRAFDENYPFPLFGVMWLLSAAALLTLSTFVRKPRTAKSFLADPVGLVIKVCLFVLVAGLWAHTVLDQWSCFMGVRYCD
jgi:hypothetical protein